MTNARLLFARLSLSVAVVSSVFIIALIIVPKYLHTADPSSFDYYDYYAEDDNSTKLIWVTCSDKFEGYCLNGGLCIYLEEEYTAACNCTGNYGGKRCEKYLWYHWKMHVNRVNIKCSLETLRRLEQQKCLSYKIFSRNDIIIFRSYVLALCHELKPTGQIYWLRNKKVST